MKVNYLMLKYMDNNFNMLDTLVALKPKEYEFFKEILSNIKGGNLFLAGEMKNKITKKLSIADATYWRRCERMVELGFIRKSS